MMAERRALLLIGSPRGIGHSTSDRLGGRVLDVLKEHGFLTEKLHVHAAMASPQELESALAVIGAADMVILSLPLYVDSFPAPVIAFLEQIAERRIGAGRARLFVIIQCGFPEKEQNATALAIAERFAAEAGWSWLGGVGLGEAEWQHKDVARALAPVAEAIANGTAIPQSVLRKAMPAWLYRFGGNIMWRLAARKHHATRSLRARPYAE
ncbi:MAG: NAD(P)H-dependent oxidoreductase [Candidatus Bipolaricaulota bacterium]|nr:NAD(P)H-dependent oxidoreductase [Candidatus Bipolaricaulota bacterium]